MIIVAAILAAIAALALIAARPSTYKVIPDAHIKELDFLDFDYLKNLDKDIIITYSPPDAVDIDTKTKKMSIKKYIKKYLDKPEWYFKCEDSYDFLDEIGAKQNIIEAFNERFRHRFVTDRRLSFWVGGKNTTTAYHTDIDDMMYLYVVKGKKKLTLIPPEDTKYMYSQRYPFSRWTPINFKDVDLKKYPLYEKATKHEIILNAGDALFIPPHWWHCVENLEPTIALTYKVYRFHHFFLTFIPEFVYSLFHQKT